MLSFFLLLFPHLLALQNGYDTIQLSNLTIDGVALLFENKNVLVKQFGKPDKIETIVSDFTNDKYRVFHYGKDIFQISSKGIVVSFLLKSNKYGITSKKIKVGVPREVIMEIFPNSSRKTITSKGIEYLRVQVDQEEDMFLGFSFAEKKVKEIKIWYNE